MKANLALKDADIKVSVNVLNHLLADGMILFVKLNGFHWNVEGIHFTPLHAFFQELYESVSETNDDLAERIRALGHKAPTSMNEFLKIGGLQESKGDHSEKDMLKIILEDLEHIIHEMRAGLKKVPADDFGTSNMLEDMIMGVEKHAWMVRAHLSK